MKTPKAEKINLPYASTVASYFGDQGAVTGNSFLGKMFAGSKRSTMINPSASLAAKATAPLKFVGREGGSK